MKLFLSILSAVVAFHVAADTYKPSAADRKSNRPVELWRYYMHGTVDLFASPLQLSFPPREWQKTTFETPYFTEQTDIVKIGKETRNSEPIDFDLKKYRGQKIRFFYWMRGIETGRKRTPQSWNDCPQFAVIQKNTGGKQISRIDSRNGAVGTFPWHCYYLDVQIAPSAAKLVFQIKNVHNGEAEFGRFSYEVITAENTYDADEQQDPDTGSNAAFPWYEPINFHFIVKTGFGSKYTWNFLRGPAGGMIGQPYDLTTFEGLHKYYKESVKVDLDQMNHGLMYFGVRLSTAKKNNVLPPNMPDNYLDEVARMLIEDQDPKTGYWGTESVPLSMSCTFHLVDMLFNFGIERTDEEAKKPMVNRCIAPYLPNPEAMVKTTIQLQSTYNNQGKKELAAWSQAAYNYTDNPDVDKSRGVMGTTMNAMRLLRMSYRFVNPELQKQIDTSVEAAFKYILIHCTTPEGLFMMSDDAPGPSRPAYFHSIIEASRYLEKRTDTSLPKPMVKVSGSQITCEKWLDRQNSIRIYALPEGSDPAKLSSPEIIGIISRGSKTMIDLDPLMATRRCAEASRKNWGSKVSPYLHYLQRKVFKELKSDLPATMDGKPLTLEMPKKIAITAVDWYGRESEPVILP